MRLFSEAVQLQCRASFNLCCARDNSAAWVAPEGYSFVDETSVEDEDLLAAGILEGQGFAKCLMLRRAHSLLSNTARYVKGGDLRI